MVLTRQSAIGAGAGAALVGVVLLMLTLALPGAQAAPTPVNRAVPAAVTLTLATTGRNSPTYPPESTFGVGYRPGPNRGRGLPIALAVVLLLGVGSGVARAASLGRFVTRTTLLPRKVRGR